MTSPAFSKANDGSLEQYFKEISRYPLIDQDEEVRLAQGIRRGEEEALNKLVRANLRFVVSVSKKYRNQGVPLQDLINEGNLGLIKAARRFDETKGIRFVTYAVWWIRQAIRQALAEQGRIVRVPMNRADELHRIARCQAELVQEMGRDPTPNEIARRMGVNVATVERAMSIASHHLSLDAPRSLDDAGSLLDSLPDSLSRGPDETTFARELVDKLEACLSTLDEREAQILRLYFGLGESRAMSLERIGVELGVTRERVRQIKEKALSRMRHASRARILETFADG